MSPFQFLLNKESFTEVCEELLTSENLKPTWPEAFDQCHNYRRYLTGLPIDPKLKMKGYVLRREDIERLLAQGGGQEAVRIYIGLERFEGGSVIRLFTVACKADGSGGYNDWHIPSRANPVTDAELGEGRPCPEECGSDNDLNRG